MKAGNMILYVLGGIFAFMGWAAFGPDISSPSSTVQGSSVGASELRMAIASGQPVMLEFSATWCGPCKQVKPLVHELAEEVAGRAKVVMIDIDDSHDVASQYDVHAVPTFIVLKNGKETERQVGGIPKSEMLRLLGL